jgi:hypothetical protein
MKGKENLRTNPREGVIMGKNFIRTEYLKRVGELIEKLEAENISFEVYNHTSGNGFIIVFPSEAARRGDVILHDYSYGHEDGFFEGYEAMSKVEGDVCIFDNDDELVEWAKQAGF